MEIYIKAEYYNIDETKLLLIQDLDRLEDLNSNIDKAKDVLDGQAFVVKCIRIKHEREEITKRIYKMKK